MKMFRNNLIVNETVFETDRFMLKPFWTIYVANKTVSETGRFLLKRIWTWSVADETEFEAFANETVFETVRLVFKLFQKRETVCEGVVNVNGTMCVNVCENVFQNISVANQTDFETVRFLLKPTLKLFGCRWNRFSSGCQWNRLWNRFATLWSTMKPVSKPFGFSFRNSSDYMLKPFSETVPLPTKQIRDLPMKPFFKLFWDMYVCQRNRFRHCSVFGETFFPTVRFLLKPSLKQFRCRWNRIWNRPVANETVCETVWTFRSALKPVTEPFVFYFGSCFRNRLGSVETVSETVWLPKKPSFKRMPMGSFSGMFLYLETVSKTIRLSMKSFFKRLPTKTFVKTFAKQFWISSVANEIACETVRFLFKPSLKLFGCRWNRFWRGCQRNHLWNEAVFRTVRFVEKRSIKPFGCQWNRVWSSCQWNR